MRHAPRVCDRDLVPAHTQVETRIGPKTLTRQSVAERRQLKDLTPGQVAANRYQRPSPVK